MKTNSVNVWANKFGVQIIDPDGFDRRRIDLNSQFVSFEEFIDRIGECTIRATDWERYEHLMFILRLNYT